ncbi:MAG: membrane protein insertase YidC [Pseudomonadota bacterium]
MEIRRTFLIVSMAVVGYFLLITWQKDYSDEQKRSAKRPADLTVAAASEIPQESVGSVAGDLPVAPQATSSANINPVLAKETTVRVKTDVLDIVIDLAGGDIVKASLPAYTESIDSKEAFVLLDQTPERKYIAQSGLVGTNGPDANTLGRPVYQSIAEQFLLKDGEEKLEVVLSLPSKEGIEIQKIYEFTRGDYLIKVSYEIVNQGSAPWNGIFFGQLKRDNNKDPSASNQGLGMSTFLGAAWWTPEKSYNKVALGDFAEEPVRASVTGGWIAMVQHYFVAAWIPDANAKNNYSTRVNAETNDNFAGFTGPTINVAPGASARQSASLYIGPKIQDRLEKISDGLELTVDYGMLWFIAQFLFWLLVKIHSMVGNWGWAIVILTILVKAAFFQLSATSYKSMAHMRRVTPEIQRLREQFANDRAKMSQAMMDLYRKEKINPLGGCLPILVQMPVFIALYWTLMESVELRHAEWILWIRDLSVMDPYFILPLIMGASMFVQMMLNPAPPDPMQARVMKIMPIVFTVMFLWFPAGLVLYWVVNNVLSIAQQAVITRQIEKSAARRI